MDINRRGSFLEAALRGHERQRTALCAPAPVTPTASPTASPSVKSVPYCVVPLNIKIEELRWRFGRFGSILDIRLKRKPLQHAQEVNVFYEDRTSEQKLLHASPVLIHGRPVVIELKKPFPYY